MFNLEEVRQIFWPPLEKKAGSTRYEFSELLGEAARQNGKLCNSKLLSEVVRTKNLCLYFTCNFQDKSIFDNIDLLFISTSLYHICHSVCSPLCASYDNVTCYLIMMAVNCGQKRLVERFSLVCNSVVRRLPVPSLCGVRATDNRQTAER